MVKRREEYLTWFEELVRRYHQLPHENVGVGLHYMTLRPTDFVSRPRPQESLNWATEAESCLAAVFPHGHTVRKAWERIQTHFTSRNISSHLSEYFAIFESGYNQIKEGRIGSLIDAVRAETEGELLDQAVILLNTAYLAAATVIAGGALETHLSHLVVKHGLSITGAGTIAKYDAAIAQARNQGTVTVYEANDTKAIVGWGDSRNEAAHRPATFSQSSEQVGLTIEGIRQFIARTS